MKKITMTMGMALVAPAIWANQYSVEVNPVYVSVDTNGGSDSAIGIGGSFYFAPVNGAGVPLGEAAFLRKASNVSLGYLTFDDSDLDTTFGALELYNQQLYLNASFARTSVGNFDADELGLKVGFMPNDTTLITAGYAKADGVIDDITSLSLAVKSVMLMVGETALNLEAEIAKADDSEDTVSYGAQADYYFNRTFSAGVSLADSDADGSETTVGVNASMFFNEQFGASIDYITVDDVDTFIVSGALRF